MTESSASSQPPSAQSHPAQSNRTWSISEAEAGSRLDVFLSHHYAEISRTFIRSQIVAGRVLVDDRRVKVAYRLHAGQCVTALPFEESPAMPQAEEIPLEILYEDEDLAVVNKSAGMVVHPAKGHWSGTLTSALSFHFQSLSSVGGPTRPGIVHRLDRDTSGCLVLSRDLEANRFLKARFIQEEVEKHYDALVRGEVSWDQQTIESPIGPDGGLIRIKMAVRADGQTARTDVTVLERKTNLSRVRCRIHTGRTHQIRVHLDSLGHALIGDRMYGVPPEVFLRTLEHGVDEEVIQAAGAPRQALHAASLSIPHPDGHTLSVRSPIPPDMARWWAEPHRLPFDLTLTL